MMDGWMDETHFAVYKTSDYTSEHSIENYNELIIVLTKHANQNKKSDSKDHEEDQGARQTGQWSS